MDDVQKSESSELETANLKLVKALQELEKAEKELAALQSNAE